MPFYVNTSAGPDFRMLVSDEVEGVYERSWTQPKKSETLLFIVDRRLTMKNTVTHFSISAVKVYLDNQSAKKVKSKRQCTPVLNGDILKNAY